ncbi:hypothetical protein SESBI_27380 [Sesbania bispinosa]|nr:hypothetical protein SESBI_27380 [Sesbania bispinosa]
MSVSQNHHRRSSEEEDLVQRSTKKLKKDASLAMEVDPEAQIQSQNRNQDSMQKVSYKDKVMEMDSSSEFLPEEIVRMVTEELFPDLNIAEGNYHEKNIFNPNPIVNVKLEEYGKLCNPWKYSLIVRLMGKRMGFRFMSLKLKHLWAKKGDVRIMDVSDDFFLNEIPNTPVGNAPTQKTEEGLVREQNNTQCMDNPTNTSPEIQSIPGHDEAIFGPWMLVKKIPRKKFKPNNQNSAPTQSQNPEISLGNTHVTSSRFDVLQFNLEDNKDPNIDTERVTTTPKHIKNPNNRPVPSNQTSGKGQKSSKPQKKTNSSQKDSLSKMTKQPKASQQIQKQKQEIPPKETLSKDRQLKKNNEDWEKEVMAMMSRYHQKRWEAYSKGEYVGDFYSCDQQEFVNTLYGSPSTDLQGYVGHSDLDKPPDPDAMVTEDSIIATQDRRAMNAFASCLDNSGLSEISSKGPFLTWQRGEIKERLDRVVSSQSWRLYF